MLPQPDAHILHSRPNFAALYKDLATNRLEQNGSSKVLDVKKVKENEVFREALQKARVEAAEKAILKDAVRDCGYKEDVLPDELQQVVQIVSAQLEGKIGEADREIVDGEIDYFMEEIDNIAPVISDHISQNVAILSQLADPTYPPSDLPAHLRQLQAQLSATRASLSRSRTELAVQTTQLLTQYTTLYEVLIRILEQVLHGSVARHTRAQAAYLSTVAEGMEKKILVLKAQVVSQVYDRETRQALVEKMEEVEADGRRTVGILRRREGMLEDLETVGRGLEKVVEDVKDVKAEILKVREEVERLEGGP